MVRVHFEDRKKRENNDVCNFLLKHLRESRNKKFFIYKRFFKQEQEQKYKFIYDIYNIYNKIDHNVERIIRRMEL